MWIRLDTISPVYIHSRIPPTLEDHATEALRTLREWNAPAASDELLEIDDLEEFQSTDLEYLLRYAVEQADRERERQARPRRRRRINAGVPSLYGLIPAPHYRGQLPHQPQQIQLLPLKPYSRQPPIPLASDVDLSEFFHESNIYARCAWIIPVRGHPPWEGSTPARIVDSDDPRQLGVRSVETTDSETKEPYICWNPDAVRAVWDFLLTFHQNGRFGPIGLAFEPVLDSETDEVSGDELDDVDYIKVYHEAYLSMYLRNVLDLWSYTPGSNAGPGASHRPSNKIRMMKGARLVLVKDGDGICIA
ncbi:hypothetical protein GLOTRDRAFT_96049 [Gloeophyllum trabeum ATCC 11539]|uniref:Uncharacterized protein n=1 Tax=Gloeophyllum trabeum (strain ATCC 11539 / FP-39264 / Madison 617) TaxID=670483 RepID=S7PWM3_GLOTA|nr:uncharacterized protein GLOTRDRAFT_96049 [Gloeophyllum trabeum ATCC 11539]EPQ51782.1 hypothetical protein GLOTRDRAFT_96049 [Gloeophyllum trabeum ATCC 11539]